MSAIITLCLNDGIIMGADSRETRENTDNNGNKQYSFVDGVQKLFRYKNHGIVWCGSPQIGGIEATAYLKELYSRMPKGSSIEQIAQRIALESRSTGDRVCCQIAGFENGEQVVWRVKDWNARHSNLNPQSGKPSIYIQWDGINDVSERIIRNSEKVEIADGVLVDESQVPTFSLGDGKRFVEEMLKRSCREIEFCGEPIYTMIIVKQGIFWVHGPGDPQ